MLGVNVVAQLHAEGHEVEAFDIDPRPGEAKLGRLGISIRTHAADVTDFVQVAATANLVRPDFIINTSVSRATDRPALMASINVMGLINLLEAARLFKISSISRSAHELRRYVLWGDEAGG